MNADTLELQQRRAKVTAALPVEADAMLIATPSNVRYLTGFSGSNALVVLERESAKATLFTDPRYTGRAAAESDCAIKTVPKGSLALQAAKLVDRKKWKQIAIEKNRVSYAQYLEIRNSLPSRASILEVAGLIEGCRMVKSTAEIAAIRTSVAINSQAYGRAIARLKPSWCESDLAGEIEYQMRRLGAEKAAFDTIVASGPKSAMPHASPARTPILNDRLLLIDMGCVHAGYASDMTRMLHVGKPRKQAKELYRAVLEAQLAAIDAVRPGVRASRIHSAATKALAQHGLDRYFVHSTGHGLGLEIHEPPRLGKADVTLLEEGMAITIEPGAYLEGFGGVRIEDTVLVTANGCEILTPTSKELSVI